MEKAELELFPRHLLFLRQQPPARTPQSNGWMNMGKTEHMSLTRGIQDCLQITYTKKTPQKDNMQSVHSIYN